jgi:hypothetical protein
MPTNISNRLPTTKQNFKSNKERKNKRHENVSHSSVFAAVKVAAFI